MKYWLLRVLHNTVVHPIMPFIPEWLGDQLHDVTGAWMAASRPGGEG